MSSSFPNINDIASVKSLLDQLSASQAWQEVANPQADVLVQPSTTENVSSPPADFAKETSATSVAALLSQLQAPLPAVSSDVALPIDVDNDGDRVEEPYAHPPRDSHPPIRHEDVRNYSFQKALPYIASLAESSALVTDVRQLKIDQDRLEKQLWEERQAIFRKYEEKVNVAKNKAKLIGTGISKHEADMIRENLKKELARFDRERALPSWDGLVTKQQTTLENLGIPAMYGTVDKAVRERQQRIIQVLEGVVGGSES